MKRINAALWLVCATIALAAPQARAKERTPPGSFLKYRATNVLDLSKQVAADATVRNRYARHFRTSPGRLARLFANELKLVAIKRPLKVTSYYVGKSGGISKKTKLLAKGSLVFAGADGAPLLAWACGNPLTARMPKRQASAASPPAAAAAEPAVSPSALANADEPNATGEKAETKVLPSPAETIAAEAVSVPPGFVAETAPALVSAEPAAVEALPAAAAEALPSVAVAPPAAVGGGAGMGWLGPLAGLIGGFVALHPHGNNPQPVPPGPIPVPEPSCLAALGTGLALAANACRRRPGFTTDVHGYGNTYLAEIPDFESLPLA